ncbi:ATP-binding protein [Cryobacterium suzukii]|uniref:ATP-binding protein n=1 Tax=Cryobacterium suzukii TaxID=1259198 RepID=A0A4R9AGW9_9MICO|nr:ATP-binding protein [Cryobacterium suzukii]TFD61516.1 ATP-binding protein [Cryobacterium suzukii]
MANISTHTLTLVSPPDDVNAVHALLETVWADATHVSATDRCSFETALIELASNVFRHADTGSGVTCGLRLEVSDVSLDARLSDTGATSKELFAVKIPGSAGVDAREMPDGLSESGRGIALIQALVDELEYSRDGDLNHWHIVRALRS